jgi:hypothetical protein
MVFMKKREEMREFLLRPRRGFPQKTTPTAL